MKRLLLFAFLLLFGRVAAQDSHFSDEWHQALESDLEYICYQKSAEVLSVRVYRGASQEHAMTIYNEIGSVVYSCEFERASDVDISSLGKGIYFICVSNNNKMLTQRILIKMNQPPAGG